MPHELVDMDPEHLTLAAMCMDAGQRAAMEVQQRINNAGGMVFPVWPME